MIDLLMLGAVVGWGLYALYSGIQFFRKPSKEPDNRLELYLQSVREGHFRKQ